MIKDHIDEFIHAGPDRSGEPVDKKDDGGLPSCEEFFNRNARFKNALYALPGVREIFDFVISRADDMIRVSEKEDKPALCALLPAVENFHDPDGGLDFKSNIFIRQFIGAVIGEIMARKGFVKTASRNISSKLAKFFKAGAIYKPMENLVPSGNKFKKSRHYIPDFESQKKNALEFAKYENFKGKIMETIVPGPNMMIFENRRDRLMTAGDPRRSQPAYDRIAEFYETGGVESVFFSAAQIAVELECRHPGIVAMSGLKFSDDRYDEWPGPGRRFYYFVDLVESTLEELTAGGICEKRTLADWFSPAFICSYNYKDFVINAGGGEIAIYRAVPPAPAAPFRRDEGPAVLISPEEKRYSTYPQYFIEYAKKSGRGEETISAGDFSAARAEYIRELNGFIVRALENAASRGRKKGPARMVSSCQLAIAAAEMLSRPGTVFSLKMIEDEFFGRLIEKNTGPGENILHAGLSLEHILFLSFSYTPDFEKSIEAPGRFLPLAAIKTDRVREDNGK